MSRVAGARLIGRKHRDQFHASQLRLDQARFISQQVTSFMIGRCIMFGTGGKVFLFRTQGCQSERNVTVPNL